MPRFELTDEKVIKDCMQTYPLPFGLAEKFLDVGTVKKADNFLPYKVEKRMPQPPGRQEFLANALIRAKNERGALKNREQLNTIKNMVLRERPFYPDYAREPEEKANELEDEDNIRAPDEPYVKQLIGDDEPPLADAREVLPEAQVVKPKRKRKTKQQMADEKAKQEIEKGKQKTITDFMTSDKRSDKIKRRDEIARRMKKIENSASEEDQQEYRHLKERYNEIIDDLSDL